MFGFKKNTHRSKFQICFSRRGSEIIRRELNPTPDLKSGSEIRICSVYRDVPFTDLDPDPSQSPFERAQRCKANRMVLPNSMTLFSINTAKDVFYDLILCCLVLLLFIFLRVPIQIQILKNQKIVRICNTTGFYVGQFQL
jgi:hypothetical protein